MATAKKWVYFFGNKKAEGRAEQKNLLGGKGANLHEMTRLGIPVPAGFTITTEACIYYTSNKKQYPAGYVEAGRGRPEEAGEGHGGRVRRSRPTPSWSRSARAPGCPCPA